MRSSVDNDLIKRDAALPGLALVLDRDILADALRTFLPDANLNTLTLGYLRYKPGTNCLTSFALEGSDGPIRGYIKAYDPDDTDKLAKAEDRGGVPGPGGRARLVLADDAVEVVFFPNDNKLKALSRFFDADQRASLLSKLLPEHAGIDSARVEELHYKPERRYVARLDIDGEPAATLKFYTSTGFPAAKTAATTLVATNGLTLPWLIGHSRRHGILAFAWLPGIQFAVARDNGWLPRDGIVRVGSALAEFHGQDVASLPVRTRQSEEASLREVARGLGFVFPSVAGLAQELTADMSAELRESPAIYRPTHGDFYDRQVLLDADHVSFLDLDEAILSDPGSDLGLFIAHLEWDVLRGELAVDLIQPLRDALLEGYRQPLERVDLYTAIGLLRLAPHHFRHREPDSLEHTLATLERAAWFLRCHKQARFSGVAASGAR